MVQVLFAAYHLRSLPPSKLFDNAHIVPCTMKSKLKIDLILPPGPLGCAESRFSDCGEQLQKHSWRSSEFKDDRSSRRTCATPLPVNLWSVRDRSAVGFTRG